MSSYQGIHVQLTQTKTIEAAIRNYFEAHKWSWKQIEPATFFRRLFDILPWKHQGRVHLPVEGWSEISISAFAFDCDNLVCYLSDVMSTQVAAFGYQTTVGQDFIHICDKGKTVRHLWYTRGQDVHSDLGVPLPFEAKIRTKRIQALRQELLDEEVEDHRDARIISTHSLPSCQDFAYHIGCASFLHRLG